MSIRFLFELDKCHHVILGFASMISPVSCPECRQLRNIHDVHVHEWHAKCRKPRCNFSRWTGISKTLAEQNANAHAKSTAHDNIVVGYDPRPEALVLQEKLRENQAI